jgi:hypothetical protein
VLTKSRQALVSDLRVGFSVWRGSPTFCRFFPDGCIDQVAFMETLLKPAALVQRIEECRSGVVITAPKAGAIFTPPLRFGRSIARSDEAATLFNGC